MCIATLALHLPVDTNVFLVNISFLLIITVGLVSFFGLTIYQYYCHIACVIYHKISLKIIGGHSAVHSQLIQSEKGGGEGGGKHDGGGGVGGMGGIGGGMDSEASNEARMVEILSKESNSRERERACHKQISHWKAMLALLSEDMIDGTAAGSGKATPVHVAPLPTSKL